MGQSRPLCLFSFFSNTNCTEHIVSFSGIQTGIIGVEGEHPDHLTTTIGPTYLIFSLYILTIFHCPLPCLYVFHLLLICKLKSPRKIQFLCNFLYFNKYFFKPTPTLMAFTVVTNVHEPSPQPTACRPPSCSLATATF